MFTSRTIDPTDPHAVAVAITSYLRRTLAPSVELTQQPASLGAGFDTFVYSFRLAGDDLPSKWHDDLVLRVYGSPNEARKCLRESAIQRFACAHYYPALEPLLADGEAEDFGLPIMLMPRVPGGTLLDQAKSHPQRARRMLRDMGRLHAQLHQLSTAGAPLAYDAPLISRVLAETRGRMDVAHASLPMEEGYRWLVGQQQLLMDEHPLVCHNDFHPLNILVDQVGRLVVIDWSNAALGDRHSDIGRTVALFWFAIIAASSTVERMLLRALRGFLRRNYLRGYAEVLPIDRSRLQLWETAHTLGGWAQLAELGARRSTGDDTTKMAQQIPPSMTEAAQGRFEQLRLQIDEASR